MRNIKKKLKIIGMIIAVIAVIAALIYFHIFWWTMLGLVVLIVVLLHFSVTIHLKASRREGIDIKAKYLFLTLYPRKKKEPEKSTAPPAAGYDDFDDSVLDDFDDEELTDADDPEVILPEPVSEKLETAGADAAPSKKDGEAEPVKDKKKRKKEKSSSPENAPGEKSKGGLAALKEKFEKVKPYIPVGWKAVKKFCKAIRFEGVDVHAEVGRFDAHEAAIYYGAVQKIVFDILSKIGLFFTLKLKRADVRCVFGENMIDGSAELTVRVRPSTLIAIAFCTGVNALRVFLRERRKRKKAAKAAQSSNAAQTAAS